MPAKAAKTKLQENLSIRQRRLRGWAAMENPRKGGRGSGKLWKTEGAGEHNKQPSFVRVWFVVVLF